MLPGATVGEWSLARPGKFSESDEGEFALQQVLAYNHATHGWFFWNWHDHQALPAWNANSGVLESRHLPYPLPVKVIEGILLPQ